MSAYEASGSLPRPGPIGRIVRLLAGLVMTWVAIGWSHTLTTLLQTFQPDATDPIEVLVVLCVTVYLMAYVPMVFGRHWRYAREVAAGVMLALGTVSFAFGDRFIGPALVIPAYAVGVASIAILAVSFMLAGVFATPG